MVVYQPTGSLSLVDLPGSDLAQRLILLHLYDVTQADLDWHNSGSARTSPSGEFLALWVQRLRFDVLECHLASQKNWLIAKSRPLVREVTFIRIRHCAYFLIRELAATLSRTKETSPVGDVFHYDWNGDYTNPKAPRTVYDFLLPSQGGVI